MRENVFRDRNLQKWQKRCILPSVMELSFLLRNFFTTTLDKICEEVELDGASLGRRKRRIWLNRIDAWKGMKQKWENEAIGYS